MLWRCSVCGYVHLGKEPPEKCPNCGAPKEKFGPVDENFTAIHMHYGQKLDYGPEVVVNPFFGDYEAIAPFIYNLPVGQEVRLHKHPTTDELFFVLKGKIRFKVGSTELVAVKGDLVQGKMNIPHTFKNIGDEAAAFLSVKAPKPVDLVFIDEEAEKKESIPETPAEFGIDPKAFWNLSYGLYLVTSHLEGKPNGQIANSVFQVTANPPHVAVCINKKNLTHEYISKSGVFGVSILDEEVPMNFIGLFGFKSGRDIDKFAEVNYKKCLTSCPIVTDYTLSIIEAKVVRKVDVGEHTIFVGEVVSSEILRQGKPLTYSDYHEKKKGKSPATAPTYRADTPKPEEPKVQVIQEEKTVKKMDKYVCNVCGYVYDPAEGDPDNGIKAGTSFEDLPADWVCPVCGAGKNEFSLQGSALPQEQKQEERIVKKMDKYVCNVCGYVYDPAEGDPDNGVKSGTSFEDLPADWVCPVCGVGKDEFSLQA